MKFNLRVVPLNTNPGGAHAAYNIVPACPHCNEVKQRRHANEFIRNGQLILVY